MALLLNEKKFVVIAAAGFGTRMNNSVPKQFLPLHGIPLIVHTIQCFLKVWKNAEFIVVLPEEEFPRWEKIRRKYLKKVPIRTTKGGATRFHSVKNGLKLVKEDGVIAIQDACRPFVSKEVLVKCLESVERNGNAVPAIDLRDSIREVIKDGSRHRNRAKYKAIQTPQCFHVSDLKKAYQQTFKEEFTDDASVAEAAGQKIFLVEGDPVNFKITTKTDLELAERVLHSVN
ncbi:MAG: 2-C-methyl-D-erythritol 4-phosphate cytidylyltransferase [Chitinophagales bacterium]|nr:2-C-methyl-D-erythritol 4-phosphate cytidylyltransferase [Chitinophagales bacterium]